MSSSDYRDRLLASRGKLRSVAASRVGARYEIDEFLHDTYVYFLKNESRYMNHPALEGILVDKIKGVIADRHKSKSYNNNDEYQESDYYSDDAKEETIIMKMTFDKAFKKIQQKCREILNLKKSGETNEEISELLEIEIGTVKSRVARCSEELRSIIFDG